MNIPSLKIVLSALAATALAAPPLTATACTVSHATYSLDGAAGIQAHFAPLGHHARMPGEVALVIESASPHKKIWYLFDTGSGPDVHLISTEDVSQSTWTPPSPDSRQHRPLFDTEYLEATQNDHFYKTRVPRAGDDAAAKLLVIDLSEALKLAGLTDQYVDQGFFKLSGCTTS